MKTELNLPWTYQEKADAYTHILRGPTNTFILQGRQISDGSEEQKMRFIAEACSNYESVKEQLSALQQENEKLRKEIFGLRQAHADNGYVTQIHPPSNQR